ncbi:alanine dehydrogenase [Ramlibacter sp. 2FC]|uniref:alanine dehydrogenase n=1 Tax=Ramlibacter sp. 2FC TaxID=2502188 RepID=UPI0010F7D4A3|nr:alanine dehydrogenase [Ramlibacter sp. 2FC]
MRVGIPREIKIHEYRVGATPEGVRELVAHGHQVLVEQGAGAAIGLDDAQYRAAGAEIVGTAAELFARAELIVKVKEPQPQEYPLLRPQQLLFTYLHLAAEPALAQRLCDAGVTAIAYETVTASDGGLPLLAPMSEVAGRMAIQAGAACLEKPRGGAGVLLAGVPGVAPAKVVILGAGVVGTNAAAMALGMGAQVTVLNRSVARMRRIDERFGGRVQTRHATAAAVEALVLDADLVVGAVLEPGAAAPKLVPRAWLARMRPGSVLVDVAIDQGGCFESSRPTTHADPSYLLDGIVHYCVANMPGAVARTASFALSQATLPFVLALADQGGAQALANDPHLAHGLNVQDGRIVHPAVARALGKP